MTYPRQLFRHPGPYGLGQRSYAVIGVEDEDEEKALIKKGWSRTRDEALGEKPAKASKAEAPASAVAFDHDGDGAPGGSAAPEKTDDLAALRAEYTEKMGKKPFPGWDADEIRKRMTA